MPAKLPEVTLILFGSTIIILLLTGLVVLSLFIQQKRKYRFRQEKLAMRFTYDQELLRSQLEIQSQAFESISRELHDNVGTLISMAMVYIQVTGPDVEKQQHLHESCVLLDEAMNTLRDISKSIHPENIQRLGWQNAFIAELDRIRRTKVFTVDYVVSGTPVLLDLGKQVIIFRILQEGLNNIVKHSEGNHITASICFVDGDLTVRVEDNGRGLPAKKDPAANRGSGLRNMMARAGMLPAKCSLENRETGGAVLTLSYPETTVKNN